MQWIAQHKGLALSIALVLGSIAIAPALADGDLGGGLGGGGDAEAGSADAMAESDASADVGDAGLDLDLDASLPDGATSADMGGLNARGVADWSAMVGDTPVDGRSAVQVTNQQAHLNNDLGVVGEESSLAGASGVHLDYADMAHPSGTVDLSGDAAGADQAVSVAHSVATPEL